MPMLLPTLLIYGCPIQLVESYKYVGIHFISTHTYIFQKHYVIKASKARNVSNATFAVESLIGCLPPVDAVTLYTARVDPHMTFGAEVVLDVDNNSNGPTSGSSESCVG